MMNRQQRRKFLRLMDTKKEKVAEVKAVWDKYFPNGDRQLSDEEFKQAQDELNKVIGKQPTIKKQETWKGHPK